MIVDYCLLHFDEWCINSICRFYNPFKQLCLLLYIGMSYLFFEYIYVSVQFIVMCRSIDKFPTFETKLFLKRSKNTELDLGFLVNHKYSECDATLNSVFISQSDMKSKQPKLVFMGAGVEGLDNGSFSCQFNAGQYNLNQFCVFLLSPILV